jgi:hypothetical protein
MDLKIILRNSKGILILITKCTLPIDIEKRCINDNYNRLWNGKFTKC